MKGNARGGGGSGADRGKEAAVTRTKPGGELGFAQQVNAVPERPRCVVDVQKQKPRSIEVYETGESRGVANSRGTAQGRRARKTQRSILGE